MADKEKKNPLQLPDEKQEYRPAEEEDVTEHEQKPSSSGFKLLLKNRRVWTVIAIVVAVGIVYQFVKVPKVKEEIQTVTRVGQPAQMQAAAPGESTLTQAQTQVPALITGETQQQADTLIAENKQSQAQIQQLQMALQQLQASVQQVNSQMSRCNAVTNLAPIQPLPLVTPTMPRVRKVTRRAAPRLIYHVRAIIPGRAWLYATRGKSNTITTLKTVAVGDRLPGYGRVERISPELGKVWTSWQPTVPITYGSNDS